MEFVENYTKIVKNIGPKLQIIAFRIIDRKMMSINNVARRVRKERREINQFTDFSAYSANAA